MDNIWCQDEEEIGSLSTFDVYPCYTETFYNGQLVRQDGLDRRRRKISHIGQGMVEVTTV